MRSRPAILALSLAALAAPLASRAAEGGVEVTRPQSKEQPARAQQPADRKEPLSAEDAALVRELALLERVELLKNLELFEPVKRRPQPKTGEP
jgi:hypothetical protein